MHDSFHRSGILNSRTPGGIDMIHTRTALIAIIVIGTLIGISGVVFAEPAEMTLPLTVSPDAIQKPGSIQVTSFPSGASVAVDGVPVNGLTPVTATGIMPGPHTVQVLKHGYADWSGNTTVRPGLKSYLYATLKPLNGTLSVQSVPTEGMVYVDNVSYGTTNVVIPDIPAGLHQVRIEKNGYLSWESPVTVTGGQTSLLRAYLKSGSGIIQVNSNPQGGSVYLDGILAGKSPATIKSVSSGGHTLMIKKSGYLAYSANVTVNPGETKFIFAMLEKTPKPSYVYNLSDNGNTYSHSSGDIVQVSLPENGSTGFVWYTTTTPGIEVLEVSFVSSNPGACGAGGTASWLLKFTGTGTQEFSGIIKPVWMPPSENDQTYNLTFIVT